MVQLLSRIQDKCNAISHTYWKTVLENSTYVVMPLEKHNFKYNMKESFPTKSNYKMYDVIISATMKALAQQVTSFCDLRKVTLIA